ncbi:MAG: rhomboid family intramembrane serine protease [Chitinophagaceae bacterium]|nr:rhomboid family intramembrane serine protease [Chitinophagaceae bacterium]
MGGFQPIPPVIKNLIIINALMWVAELTFKEPFIYALSLHYHASPEFGLWQIVTHMFLHSPGSFFHLLFNMFGLYMFGSTLENLWGSKRFFIFYMLCGIGAGIIQLLANFVEITIITQQFAAGNLAEGVARARAEAIYNGIALGASGAVMGVFAGFAYLFPNTPLMIFPLPIPIKAKYLITGLILLDLFGGINPKYGGGVAHFAHIGGALFGLILVKTMNKNNRSNFY